MSDRQYSWEEDVDGSRPIGCASLLLGSVVKAFGTTMKKASKKEVEADILEMGGMVGA
jgi:hypothetical protein